MIRYVRIQRVAFMWSDYTVKLAIGAAFVKRVLLSCLLGRMECWEWQVKAVVVRG